MKVVLFLVIFSLVANSQASLSLIDQSFEGHLAPYGVDIRNMTLPVFGGLSLTHKKGAILVCIRRLVQPELNTRRWSPTTCSSYLDLRNVTDSGAAAASRIVLNSRSVLTKQGSQYPLPIELLEGLYFIGFSSEKATNYSVDLTANTCDEGYFGDQCAVKVDSTLPFNSSAPISLVANETKIYQLTPTTTNSSYLLQHVEFTGEFDPTSVIVSRVKSLNIPTQTDYEGSYTFSEAQNQTKFILPSPSTYRWFLSLKSKLPANFHLLWNSTQCDMGKAGPSCQDVSVLSGVNTTQAQIFTTGASDWQYFQWDLNANNSYNPFSFTVQNFASNGSAPDLYLRLGQVPTEDSYDLRVINNTVNRVDSAQAAYGSWYIGIKGNGLKYGFWYNGNCPSDCNGHGSCQLNPDGSYQCVCDDLYTNFDCSKRQNLDGFRKVYLVIIIIGAALFGVAGLGFFCLFVMRRKRVEGYEILSQT